MSSKVGILDVGLSGNIHSLNKALKKAHALPQIISRPDQLEQIDKLLLPGVGAFPSVMKELEQQAFSSAIQQFDRPILGICLGMQLLASAGEEQQPTTGLGLIEAKVKRIKTEAVLPHVGFKKLNIVQDCSLMQGVEEEAFYFMHSYEMSGGSFVTSFSHYDGQKIVSSVRQNQVYGVQFHPEKSRLAGIKVLENFVKI